MESDGNKKLQVCLSVCDPFGTAKRKGLKIWRHDGY